MWGHPNRYTGPGQPCAPSPGPEGIARHFPRSIDEQLRGCVEVRVELAPLAAIGGPVVSTVVVLPGVGAAAQH